MTTDHRGGESCGTADGGAALAAGQLTAEHVAKIAAFRQALSEEVTRGSGPTPNPSSSP